MRNLDNKCVFSFLGQKEEKNKKDGHGHSHFSDAEAALFIQKGISVSESESTD